MQSPTTWRFKKDQTEYVVPVRSRLIVSNLESACDAARAGIGIAEAFSYHVAESISPESSHYCCRIFAAAATRQLRVLAQSLHAGQVARIP